MDVNKWAGGPYMDGPHGRRPELKGVKNDTHASSSHQTYLHSDCRPYSRRTSPLACVTWLCLRRGGGVGRGRDGRSRQGGLLLCCLCGRSLSHRLASGAPVLFVVLCGTRLLLESVVLVSYKINIGHRTATAPLQKLDTIGWKNYG